MTGDEGKQSSGHSKRPKTTKVVLRRLPPGLSEQELLEQITPLEYDFFYFSNRDMSLSPWVYCRAYFAFAKVDDVLQFRDRFDGYVFVDSKGNESAAMVELAPCQKIPKHKPEKSVSNDVKYCGKIEQDSDYKKFLEDLESSTHVKLPSLEACLEDIEKKTVERKELLKQNTPLIEYILWKKDERVRRQADKRRLREEQRRLKAERERQERERREKERQKAREREQKEREKQKEKEEKAKQKEKESEEHKKEKEKPPRKVEQVAPRFAKQKAAKDAARRAETSRTYEERTERYQSSSSKRTDRDYEDQDTKGGFGKSYSRSRGNDKPWSDSTDRNNERSEGDNDKRSTKESKGLESKDKKRNKERPSLQLYQPGHRKKQTEHDKQKEEDTKETEEK